MAEGGWADPKVALTVYAHAMRRDDQENTALRGSWKARKLAVMAVAPILRRPSSKSRRPREARNRLYRRAPGGPYWFNPPPLAESRPEPLADLQVPAAVVLRAGQRVATAQAQALVSERRRALARLRCLKRGRSSADGVTREHFCGARVSTCNSMNRSGTPMTSDSTARTTRTQAATPDSPAPKRELRPRRLVVVAGVLITAAWGLALVFFAWSLLAAIL